MYSEIYLKVINEKGMHAIPSAYLCGCINTIKNRYKVDIILKCKGKCDGILQDLSLEEFTTIDIMGYEKDSLFVVKIIGEKSREALNNILKENSINKDSLQPLFPY